MNVVRCRLYTAQMLALAAVLAPKLIQVELSAAFCTPAVLSSLVLVSERLQGLYPDEWTFAKNGSLTTTQSCLLLGLRQLQVCDPFLFFPPLPMLGCEIYGLPDIPKAFAKSTIRHINHTPMIFHQR